MIGRRIRIAVLGVLLCGSPVWCAPGGPSLLGVTSDQGQGSGQAAPAPAAYTGDLPDPFVVNDNGTYIAYGTNANGANVPFVVSTDLKTWTWGGDAMPQMGRWTKAGPTNWAPGVLRRGDTWVIYYTARYGATDKQAVGVAVASSPRGPFVDESAQPLIASPEEGGAIDASPFVDEDGRAYLLWKGDGNAINVQTHLYIQELAADGRSLVGSKTSLLVRDAGWEKPLVEGPSLVRANGKYHLFYSAGWWESAGYGVGHAVSSGLRGPYTKTTTSGPLLGSHGAEQGPGGQEFFAGPGGLWMAYHAWTAPKVGYANGGARSLHVTPVRFEGDTPKFGEVAPVQTPATPPATPSGGGGWLGTIIRLLIELVSRNAHG